MVLEAYSVSHGRAFAFFIEEIVQALFEKSPVRI